MLGCAAYWEHEGLKVPALPLASCGISGRPLPFSVPLCSYLHKERVGSAAPRPLRVVMLSGSNVSGVRERCTEKIAAKEERG